MESLVGLLGVALGAAIAGGIAAWNSGRERRQREEHLQREHEYETRELLRVAYADILVKQRASRSASLKLAEAHDQSSSQQLQRQATEAHDDFIAAYHRLNLDSSRDMWLEARGLRDVLDDMLEFAEKGQRQECNALIDTARDARQNLERSFRLTLGYEPHQKRRPLGKYDKVTKDKRIGKNAPSNDDEP